MLLLYEVFFMLFILENAEFFSRIAVSPVIMNTGKIKKLL
jgi:hypothetical protein